MATHGTADKLSAAAASARNQGLTLVHYSAQRKRFLWEGGDYGGVHGVVHGVSTGVFGGT
jgi:hypothetical protein